VLEQHGEVGYHLGQIFEKRGKKDEAIRMYALAAGAMVTFALATGLTLEPAPALWVLFTLAAALAFLRLYRHAVRSPFELLALRSFQADLKATLLYGGVAWGAGMFLAGPQDNLLIIMAFSVGMVILVELVLRAPTTALYFAIPSIIVPAAAVALGPLGPAPACLIVAAGACVLAGADIAAKLLAARRHPPLVTVS